MTESSAGTTLTNPTTGGSTSVTAATGSSAASVSMLMQLILACLYIYCFYTALRNRSLLMVLSINAVLLLIYQQL